MNTLTKVLIAGTLISSLAACTNTPNNTTVSSPSPTESPTATNSPAAESPAATESPAAATKVEATLKEMSIQLSSNTVPAGPIEFAIKNDGKEPHEFVVLKTDLPDSKLSLKENKLDEDTKGIEKIGEVEEDDLKSGGSDTLKLDLKPGRYLIICNLPGHYQAGMKTELIVK